MLVSRNHSERACDATAPRPLKNVIVTLDWVPDPSLLVQESSRRVALSPSEEAAVAEAFGLFDVDGNGALSRSELKPFMATADADVDCDTLTARSIGEGNASGELHLAEVREALEGRHLYVTESGRFMVAVSLAEAETLRAVLHAAGSRPLGAALIGEHAPGRELHLALRARGKVLDASAGFVPAPRVQKLAADASFRFIDSHADLHERGVDALLRALHANSPDARTAWWLRVRSRRRRPKKEWQQTSLALLFTAASEVHGLKRAALVSSASAH